jgi:hypothetical protein
MLFALLSKRASHHRELPDSSESLNRMFGRHWRVIGERVEDANMRRSLSYVSGGGALFLEVARDAGLALRHMTPLPLRRQNPAHHEPGRFTIGGRQLESAFPAMQRPFEVAAA